MANSKLILIVDDEPIIAVSLCAALEGGGYETRVANNGITAISVLDGQECEVVGLITDINLGHGPDGWDVARRTREQKGELPVVYISGDSAHEHPSLGVPNSVMV